MEHDPGHSHSKAWGTFQKPTAMLPIRFRLSSHRAEARQLNPGNPACKGLLHTYIWVFCQNPALFWQKWHFISHDITETGFLSVGLSYLERIRENLQTSPQDLSLYFFKTGSWFWNSYLSLVKTLFITEAALDLHSLSFVSLQLQQNSCMYLSLLSHCYWSDDNSNVISRHFST